MPRRRHSIAPQSEIQVLRDQVEALRKEVATLRQPGPSSLQADDYEKALDPVPWQTIIHHPGNHVDAEPSDPVVYYHPGDDVIDAGFKKTIGFVPATTTEMPGVSVFSDGVTLAQATMNPGPIWIEKPLQWPSPMNPNGGPYGSGTNVHYVYDYSNAGSKVYDVAGTHLPGLAPIGVKKKGLYLLSARMGWELAWGKLTRFHVAPHSSGDPTGDPLNMPYMYGWGSGDSYPGLVIGDEGETGDTNISVSTSTTLMRKVSDSFTQWPRVMGRHTNAATRTLSIYFTIIRLSPNPYDTNLFDGGTIPG